MNSIEEIKAGIESLLASLAAVSSDGGNGLVEFLAYAKANGHPYSMQTLLNYRNGAYKKNMLFSYDAYLKRYVELGSVVKSYVHERNSKDSYLALRNTVWLVYFLNWSKHDQLHDLGMAIIEFYPNRRAKLTNLPDKLENPDKEGPCFVSGSVLSLNLENRETAGSHLNIMLDVTEPLPAKAEVMIGGYQSRERGIVTVGTLLFRRAEGNIRDARPMAMSLSKNRKEFLDTPEAIRHYLSSRTQNLIKVIPNPSGTLEGLNGRITRFRTRKQNRIVSPFVEPGPPKVFISVPNSGVDDSPHAETVSKVNGIRESLLRKFKSDSDKAIEVIYLHDKDANVYDYTENMGHIKKTSIFVFIYPYDRPILSTAFVELGWAFLASRYLLTYAKPDVLPQRLENYLRHSSEDIVHSSHVDYDRIERDIAYHLEKVFGY